MQLFWCAWQYPKSQHWATVLNLTLTHCSHLSWTLSRCILTCILLDYGQFFAWFIPVCYCTESYIYCLNTLSHIPQHSILITANGTNTQPGEESLCTEQSRSLPWECTHIQESNHSSLSIKYIPFNYLHSSIMLWITNVPNLRTEVEWQCISGEQWCWGWGYRSVNLNIPLRRRRYWSTMGGSSSRPAMLGRVIMNDTALTANGTELCWCCRCLPCRSKSQNPPGAMAPAPLTFQKSTLLNKLFKSDHAPSTHVLPLPNSGGDQHVPQPKSSGDQQVPQNHMPTAEVVIWFTEAFIIMRTFLPMLSNGKYSMVDEVWKLAIEVEDQKQALADAPEGTPSVYQLPGGPSRKIDLQTWEAVCLRVCFIFLYKTYDINYVPTYT